jgi:heavy metal sensor kinase
MGRWQALDLRVRLAVWYGAAVALAVLAYAGGVYVFVGRGFQEQLDRALRDDFELVERTLDRDGLAGITDRPDGHHEDGEPGRSVEVWSVAGELRARTSVGAAAPPPIPAAGGYVYSSATDSSGRPMRTVVGTHSVAGSPVVIRVGRSEEGVRHELRELLLGLATSWPIAVLLAACCGYYLARRALRPIDQMTTQAASITAERLRARLPVENPRDELGRLATVFNQMLERLEGAFDQLRRFTADASHELRTPLTAIRSVGEVGLREPRDAHAYREIIGSMLEEADRLTGLVDGLLYLSRADSGRTLVHTTEVDVRALIDDVATHLAVLADERGQRIVVAGDPAVTVRADPVLLRPAVINILDNAIKYSAHGSEIRITARTESQHAVIEVRDQGPGIAAEHHARVFERFYRVDAGRSRGQGGTGLGLAIARWAVEASGGSIELESELGLGSVFRVRLARVDVQVDETAGRVLPVSVPSM